MPADWVSNFETSPLWDTIQKMQEQLDGLQRPPEPDAAQAYARLLKVTAQLAAHREQDPSLYPANALAQLASAISQPASYLSQYVGDPDVPASLVSAASASVLDPVVSAMASLPALPHQGQASAAGRAAATFEKASREALGELEARLGDLDSEMQQVSQQLNVVSKSAAQQVTGAIEQAEREAREEQRVEWREQLAEVTDATHEARANLMELAEIKTQASSIAAALADKAVAKDYAANARNKSIAGWVWDVAGAGVGLWSLILVARHLFGTTNEPTIQIALARLALSMAGIGVAALCFARARGFHREAQISKRAHLRVTTAGGFMANMDEVTREAILQGMAERIYMRGELEAVPDDEHHDLPLSTRVEALLKRRREEAEQEGDGA